MQQQILEHIIKAELNFTQLLSTKCTFVFAFTCLKSDISFVSLSRLP
jgi:hypothetical protein